jgi:hypothetical protein
MPVREKRQYKDSTTDPARTGEVLRTEDMYQASREVQDTWAKQSLKNDEFYNGKQWRESDISVLKDRNEAPQVHNVLRPAGQTKVSLLTARSPQFQTTGREDTDTGLSRVWNLLLQYVWEQSSGNAELKLCVHDYVHRGGRGEIYSYWDPALDFGKGLIRHKRLDPLSVHPDPNSTDIYRRDASWLIHEGLLSYDQAVRIFPEKADIIERASSCDEDGLPDTDLGHYERDGTSQGAFLRRSEHLDHFSTRFRVLTRFERISEPYHRVVDTETGEEEVFSEPDFKTFMSEMGYVVDQGEGPQVSALGTDFRRAEKLYRQMAEAHGMDPENPTEPVIFHLMQVQAPDGSTSIEVMPGPEHEGAVPGSTVVVAPVPRSTLLEQGKIKDVAFSMPRIREHVSIGGLELYDRVLPIMDFPITPIYNGFNGNCYPTDDIHDVRSIQEGINFTHQKILSHLANSAGSVIIAPENFFANPQIAEQKLAQPGTKVLYGRYDMLEGKGDIKTIQLPTLPGELYLKIERDKADIFQIMGISEALQGFDAPDRQPFRGTLLQDEQAQRRLKGDLDNIEGALSHHGRVVVQMLQHYLTEERVIRLIQPSGEIEQVEVNQPVYDDYGAEIERIGDLTTGTWDVIVVGGSTLPSNRWATAEYYERLAEKGFIPLSEFLRKSEVFDVERILAEVGEINQLRAALEQAQGQLKDMDGLIQRQDSELRQLKRRVDSAKFQEALAKTGSRVERDQAIASARLSDEVKLAKERMALAQQNGTTDKS